MFGKYGKRVSKAVFGQVYLLRAGKLWNISHDWLEVPVLWRADQPQEREGVVFGCRSTGKGLSFLLRLHSTRSSARKRSSSQLKKAPAKEGDEVEVSLAETRKCIGDSLRRHHPPGDLAGELQQLLFERFGHFEFREKQLEVITAVLKSRDAFCVACTGFGKSLCYQLPTMYNNRGRTRQSQKKVTLVFTPTISLMIDQVNALNSTAKAQGRPDVACYLANREHQSLELMERALNAEFEIVYVTPEKVFDHNYTAGAGNQTAHPQRGFVAPNVA